MEGMLESIHELNLSWLLILACKGGKFGGWVSELLCWFYASLDDEIAVPRTMDHQSGTSNEGLDW